MRISSDMKQNKKQVLIITYAYPPNNVPGAQRPYALAKYLDKNRYDVKVITCSNPDLPLGKNEGFDPALEGVELMGVKSKLGTHVDKFRDKSTSENKKRSVLSKLKSFLFKVGQKMIFPDKGVFWSSNVIDYLKKNPNIISDSNIVFSSSPGVTDHILAKYVKSRNEGIKWHADFRDFNYVGNMQYKSGWKISRHKKLEADIIKEADTISFVTKTMQHAYQVHYPNYADKMHAIYNGLEKSDFNFNIDKKERDKSNKLTFFYAGTFYNGIRSPFPLLELLDHTFKKSLLHNYLVEINIAGNIDEDTRTQISRYESGTCVKYLGNLPRREVLQHMTNTTFLWLIVGNIKSHYQTVPIKLFEYIAARRPIINFAPDTSEPSQIISDNNLGYNFNTLDFDLDDSYTKFEQLIYDYFAGKFHKDKSAESLDLFSWENQIIKIENLFA